MLDEHRRLDGRRVTTKFFTLLAVRDEQHDLSRAHAAIVEELPRGFEARGDRGLAVRLHLVDSRVDLGLVGRPRHARRRARIEGHNAEARLVVAEGVLADQLLGEGLQPGYRAVRLGPLHRAAVIEHQSEVDRRRAGHMCSWSRNSGGLDAVQHAGSDDHLEQNRDDLR